MTALLDLVQADVTLRRSSSRELAGPCPKCGGNDRFTVTPGAGSDGAGLWWCRGCNAGGDAVSYLREVRGLSYRDACSLLDRDPGVRTQPPRPREQRPKIEVKACPPPPDPWQVLAERLVTWAQANMNADAGERSRTYLAGRGLDGDALSQHRFGYVPQNLFRDRAEWGLPEELRDDGKPKKLFIPAGIVIPCLDGAGHVVRVRIRREAADDGPRYHTLAGSSSRCLVAGSGPAVVIVESDLDALLLGVVAGDLVRAVSLGSAQSRPDEDAGAIVEAASVVLVSLDSDKAGAAAAWSKWTGAPKATRWPIPPECGKDPGDAYRAGYDLREWVQDGLVDAVASPNSSAPTRTHETAAPASNSESSAKRAEPAEASPIGDGVGEQDAPAVEVLPPGPFTAVCVWLSSLHLTPEHGRNTGAGKPVNTATTRRRTPVQHPEKHPGPDPREHGRITGIPQAVSRAKDGDEHPGKHPAEHPVPEAPPYVLRLVSLLGRIGDGTADDSDRLRLRSWLPNGIFNARLVHRRDLAAGAVLLAELGAAP